MVEAAVKEKMMEQIRAQIDHVIATNHLPPIDLSAQWPHQLEARRSDHANGGIGEKLTVEVFASIVDARNDRKHDSFEEAIAKLNPRQKQRREEGMRLRREWEARQKARRVSGQLGFTVESGDG